MRAALVTLGRRAVALSVVAGLLLLLVAGAPLFAGLALAHDLARRTRLGALRTLGMVVVLLGCELAGVAAALWLLLARRRGEAGQARFLDANFRLQCWWAGALFAAGRRLFDLGLECEGDEVAAPGPILLLVRHASVADTLLPAVLVSARRGLRLRYVLKRELLWDPCLDIVGQRLPNAFVRRGAADTQGDLARVRALAEGLGPRDGVLIFPEGTRFAAGRRQAIIDRLEGRGAFEAAAQARALRHLLPPRLGGTLAVLDGAPTADVVFCAHVGFDAIRRLGDLIGGRLVRQRLAVRFWRCPRGAIPKGREAQARWLGEQWQRLDDWVAERRAAVAGSP